MRKKIYSIESPKMILFDIVSTLFPTYRTQEGEGFNYHYSSHGYHPLLYYGEFQYQAGSWEYPRRVVVKVEKPNNQITYLYTFIVINMELSLDNLIKLYCNRGHMENFIKELKMGLTLIP